jgi:hypothetical protein
MRILITTALLAGSIVAGGCNNAKSPEAVASDVDKAEQSGANEVARSEERAGKDVDKAAAQVDDKLLAFNNAATEDAYHVAVAKADADRKLALAQCEAQSGDAQKVCRNQAEADYTAAKADAKAAAQSAKL